LRGVDCKQPNPEIFTYALSHFGPEVYQTIWGPSEFTATGNLQDVSLMNELTKKIATPTLITCGRTVERNIAKLMQLLGCTSSKE
jgi:proline iminopeptidase